MASSLEVVGMEGHRTDPHRESKEDVKLRWSFFWGKETTFFKGIVDDFRASICVYWGGY